MKKIVVAPDSYKGTISSLEASEIMAKAVKEVFPQAQVVQVPIADGGEGSVEAFLSANGGKKVIVETKGPNMEDLQAYYGVLSDGQTAVIEMASAAGLGLLNRGGTPAMTTTYGVGLLMKHALQHGCKKLILCLGGSCTNDMGCGAAVALGAKFELQEENILNEERLPVLKDGDGNFLPTGMTLHLIKSVNMNGYIPELKDAEIVAMCDITNPLYGYTGAAYIFAPQKGASDQMVQILDENMRKADKVLSKQLGVENAWVPGAGAAGGMGYGMVTFFGAKMQLGIDTILQNTNFDKCIEDADLILTGEGKLDASTVNGKVISGITSYANRANVPVVALVGNLGEGANLMYQKGLTAAFVTNISGLPVRELEDKALDDLRDATLSVMRLIKSVEKV